MENNICQFSAPVQAIQAGYHAAQIASPDLFLQMIQQIYHNKKLSIKNMLIEISPCVRIALIIRQPLGQVVDSFRRQR